MQQRDQDTFEAQYKLVAAQEEVDRLRGIFEMVEDNLRVALEENDALKKSLKEEEVARIAAEGMIALPTNSQSDDDLMSSSRRNSPAKRNGSPFSNDKENAGVVTKKMLDSKRFDQELARERQRRQHAEDLVEFLRLECHFRCCPCRSSDHAGHDQSLSVSGALGKAFEDVRSEMRAILKPSAADHEDHDMEVVEGAKSIESVKTDIEEESPTALEIKLEETPEIEMQEAFPTKMEDAEEEIHRSVTMAEETADEKLVRERMEDCAVDDEELPEKETLQAPGPTPAALTPEPEMEVETEREQEYDIAGDRTEADEGQGEEKATPTGTSTKVPLLPSSPDDDSPTITAQSSTPYRSVSRTYTTTIPMKFTPVKPAFAAARESGHVEEKHELTETTDSPRSRHGSAPTFDRAAALAAIAYRRGRAKSIADGQMTPRKQMLQTGRRDVSAPTLGQKSKVTVGKGVSASAGRSRNGMRG